MTYGGVAPCVRCKLVLPFSSMAKRPNSEQSEKQFLLQWRCRMCEHEFTSLFELRKEEKPKVESPECPECGDTFPFHEETERIA